MPNHAYEESNIDVSVGSCDCVHMFCVRFGSSHASLQILGLQHPYLFVIVGQDNMDTSMVGSLLATMETLLEKNARDSEIDPMKNNIENRLPYSNRRITSSCILLTGISG